MPDVLMLAEAAALRAVFSLPRPALRALVGKPVVIDGNTLDLEIHALMRLQALASDTLSAASVEDRRTSMSHNGRLVAGRQPIGRVESLEVDGAEGPLGARLYVPRADSSALLVYFHGGGWALGDLDSHDPVCRFFAERAGVRVLSVDYRLAPEHPYPAGPDDAWAATHWAVKNANELGVDPARIAVGGDSAGGSLAALTAMRAAESGVPLRAQLLVYPATRIGQSGHSRKLFGDKGYVLTHESMDFFDEQYLRGGFVGDPGHSVGYRESFPEGLAPTIIAIAGFDPLRDEEKDYVQQLQDAGLPVTERYYPGFVHGFVNMLGYTRAPRKAVAQLAADLKAALA